MLMPVWSIGLCNFCRYYGENTPTQEEINKLLTFCTSNVKDKEILNKVSPHSVAVHNWRKVRGGRVVLIDYGVDPSNNDYWGYILRTSGIKIAKSGWPDLS